ncbi:CALMODULIN-BINDING TRANSCRIPTION ACTIVATOR 4 [Salix koriyanagi]|uniref:CALMODULIN-BINDING TRANSCRIPTION ACTIVATOR 4 n=1 Tax=Salix koriyanagi TaxID=2511006 RepID=A0A9Q0PVD0_9ROSI|nr:CALMODULIN-BINDING TRANSCRIPTION ACTIVATOR 4 [Salix koriyanagi]
MQVIIVGSFLCDPSESSWTCMLGDTEVPLQIIQEGVICCEAPPHQPGKVTLCITSGNRESCKGDSIETEIHLLQKLKADDDSWGYIIEGLLIGSGTSSTTVDWLLQQLLKDKLRQWLSSKSQEQHDHPGCSLSKKEQGIIHMLAGLGFEWALSPILSHGVSINFRDINGWTALHWAARFGREKMVASLLASGASAGAVTDPSSQDPIGKTAASIAASSGHKGLAGYLSELALTSHLSSLRLKESELSKGSAEVEAERAVDGISKESFAANEDQVSLKDTLAAVRNAAQAAARIQSAFRAHSFRRRQDREASILDEYGISAGDIQGLSAMSKLAFRNTQDINSAAFIHSEEISRMESISLSSQLAHVRGYRVRKNYKVICWAVGILDKVVLRWRRKGIGLRGFRNETESIDEREDDDILKMFRKQKVDGTIDEAFSRVLSMVDSPDARQQYHRMLQRYRQAKAELGTSEAAASTSLADANEMGNDDLYLFQ